MRAQALSDAAGSQSALAPLRRHTRLSDSRLPLNVPNTKQPGQANPPLDGVGITPQPETSIEIPFDHRTAIDPPTALSGSIDADVQRLLVRAYSLVAAALLLSAAIASQIPISEDSGILAHQLALQFFFILEVMCVAVLPRFVPKLPRNFAAILLFAFAAINGVSFTVFLIWIPAPALAYAFMTCALGFGASAAIARWRDIDLSSPQGIGLLFVTGIVLISITSFALRLHVDYFGTAFTAFVLFAALASYYCDDIRALDLEFDDDPSGWKSAICGALILYLNFINLYLLVMRLLREICAPHED